MTRNKNMELISAFRPPHYEEAVFLFERKRKDGTLRAKTKRWNVPSENETIERSEQEQNDETLRAKTKHHVMLRFALNVLLFRFYPYYYQRRFDAESTALHCYAHDFLSCFTLTTFRVAFLLWICQTISLLFYKSPIRFSCCKWKSSSFTIPRKKIK